MSTSFENGISLKKVRLSHNLDTKFVSEKIGVSEHLITAMENDNQKAFTSILVYKMTARKLSSFYKEESDKRSITKDSIPLFLRTHQ